MRYRSPLIVMALAVMKRDHSQNAAVAAEAPTEDMVRFDQALLARTLA